MEGSFSAKEIVWAKVKGYPWWPAEITKVPTPQNNVFKVAFVAEETHAFLNPKDVRKYTDFYDECAKKKMKGLALAIQVADELHLKRIQSLAKTASLQEEPTVKKNKGKNKQKCIKKATRKPLKSSESDSQDEKSDPEEEPSKQEQHQLSEEKEESQPMSEQNVEEDKFLGESSEKIDRNKLDTVENTLLKVVQKVKENSYTFRQTDFCGIESLNGDELILGRITNILNYILEKLPKPQSNQSRWLRRLKDQAKERVLEHLYDTSYYDQYIKLIEKNKKNRKQYENKIMVNLKNQYKLKKEIASTFACRLMTEINNGTIAHEKQLLEDLKEKKIEIVGVNNKAAIDRCIQCILPKYM